MFKRLMVPLDGSHLAEAVLPAARYLADHIAEEVVLFHVIEKNAPLSVHGDMHLSQPDQATRYLQEIASQFPPQVKVETHVHDVQVSSVAASIADHASELSVDLVVMCTHGQGGLTGWWVGSIAQQVIAVGSVPVLLVSPNPENRGFACQEIFIPLDGDPEHEAGLSAAQAIAGGAQSRLHLLQVIPTLGTLTGEAAAAGLLMPGSTQKLLDMAEQEAQAHLAEHARQLEAAGFAVTTQVRRGDPASQIIEQAQKLPADLIVLGTHGKAGHTAFWEGSVAPKIPGRTNIPLLMVPVRVWKASP